MECQRRFASNILQPEFCWSVLYSQEPGTDRVDFSHTKGDQSETLRQWISLDGALVNKVT